jgi:LuxR family maltose regulon positive regulatory protein
VLLATKLRAPSARRELVSRTALLGELAAERGHKLTLLSAPPGSGKTTLLAAWRRLEQPGRAFAWLSLDGGDNDPARFWTYAVEALRTVEPGVGAATLGLLRAPGAQLLEGIVTGLVNDLATRSGQLALVLDDYHLITNPEIHESLAFLLEHQPPGLHLVVATRSDPPLPLPRLRARGELLELRAAELRFAHGETELFLNGLLGLGLDAVDIASLHDRTEGWAAGLYLAALSLQGRADAHEFIEAFAGDDRHVVDYLVSEVLDRETDGLRSFLVRTSPLERLSGPLCDAVLQEDGSRERLEQLERSNLFLVPLDSRREWYRYHHLFAELLLHELRLTEPALEAELHRRARAWYRDHGFPSEAIRHALLAGEATEAGELIALNWNTFFNLGRLATVTGWLDALPREAVANDPRLCIARAWLALDLGRVADVDGWIDAAERAIPPGTPGNGSALIRSETSLLRTVYRFKIGDIGPAQAAARATLELAPAEASFARTAAHCVLGITLYFSGDVDQAVDVLHEAVRLARSAGNDLAASYALGYLSVIHAERMELQAAEELASTALHLSDEPGFGEHFVTMMAHLGLAKVRSRQGSLEEAETAASRALGLGLRGAGRIEITSALLTLAEIRSEAGAAAPSRALLKKARLELAKCPDARLLAQHLGTAERRLRAAPRRAVSRDAVATEELTGRELAVLRLLGTDLSQREIGAELYVSINTVKTHTRTIFRKLRASSRGEAVERARALELLE